MWEALRDAWLQLPGIEQEIRGILLWDVGESRLLLWLSAFASFFVAVNLIALPGSWLIGQLAKRFLPERFD